MRCEMPSLVRGPDLRAALKALNQSVWSEACWLRRREHLAAMTKAALLDTN